MVKSIARITINPDIMVGKPTIRGMRITVEQIFTRFSWRYASKEPVTLEPAVSLVAHNCWDYVAPGSFDFLFLAQSPRYTPASSDRLIGVIREYIQS